MASEEAQLLRTLFPEYATVMEQYSGAVDAVLRGMETRVAFHGTQDARDPTKSVFIMYDGRLELSRLISTSLPHADLRYVRQQPASPSPQRRPFIS